MENELSKLFYSPSGFTNKYELHKKIIDKFPDATVREIDDWLNKQPIVQINKKRGNRYANYGHYLVTKPNFLHQADLLFMPLDYKGYRYILTLIDTATRYKAGEPIKDKNAKTLVKAIEKIYKDSTFLKYPKQINLDSGSEFKNSSVIKLFEEHGTQVNFGDTNYHRSQSMAERFNRTLSERIFKLKHYEEMKHNINFNEWSKYLQNIIAQINSETTRMIHMSPDEATEQDYVHQYPSIAQDTDINFNVGDKVRYRLESDESHIINDSIFENGELVELSRKSEKRRVTDPSFSLSIHKVERILKKEGLPNLYYINGVKHGFTGNRLMKV
jgi:transposase InsO family protein